MVLPRKSPPSSYHTPIEKVATNLKGSKGIGYLEGVEWREEKR